MTSIVPVNFASPLSGNETMRAFGVSANGQPSGQDFLLTTGQIAALAGQETTFLSTAITTVGNGTLTAASLLGDQIVRTGPTGAYSDATDTATAIVAAFPGGSAAGSNIVQIKNATAFTQTLTAGTGVTLPPTVIIPAFSVGIYAIVPTSATAVTFTHLETVPVSVGQVMTAPISTALATNGAGTITAAGIAGGITTRTTVAAAFTDTTDTAANIIAAAANLVGKVGASFIYTYQNSSTASATLTGGTGVTVSGITNVPANMSAQYLVTYTAAATITMVGLNLTLNTPNSGTFTNNGTSTVTTANAAVTANSNIIITLKTVGGTVGAIPHLLTITPGTGFATVGTASDTSVYNYLIIG